MATKRRNSLIQTNLREILGGKTRLGHGSGEKRKVAIIKTSPTVGNKMLSLKALAYGTKQYSVSISFFGVKYSPQMDKDHPLTVDLGNGNYGGMAQLSYEDKVQVRCTCPDYYFTWYYYNHKKRALSGPAMKPYVRKTVNYPERNPLHTVGCCKHIIEAIYRLRVMRIIK